MIGYDEALAKVDSGIINERQHWAAEANAAKFYRNWHHHKNTDCVYGYGQRGQYIIDHPENKKYSTPPPLGKPLIIKKNSMESPY